MTADNQSSRPAVPAPGKAGAPGVGQAFAYHAGVMGVATAWFAAILAAVLALLFLLGLAASRFAWLDPRPELSADAIAPLFANASGFYLVVMGIVMPFYLPLLLDFGVTRGRHARALLLAGVCAAAALAVLDALLGALTGGFQALSVPAAFTGGCALFLVGWLAVLGYQFRRVLGAVVSTAAAAALLFLLPFGGSIGRFRQAADGEDGVFLDVAWSAPDGPMPILWLALVSVALAVVIVPLTSRIPVKA
ncbi:MAG: hypothetical protein LBS27_10200 [Bifidobacteriaceae bacterium]|nr:hypothetical protein [Bifidobacteriaceae bacterium]